MRVVKNPVSVVCKEHARLKPPLRRSSTSSITVHDADAFPNTIFFHMPVVPATGLAEHPLGLEIEKVGESHPEACEEPDQAVEKHACLWVYFGPDYKEGGDEADRDRCVPRNLAHRAGFSKENPSDYSEPEDPKPVYRMAKVASRRNGNSCYGTSEKGDWY